MMFNMAARTEAGDAGEKLFGRPSPFAAREAGAAVTAQAPVSSHIGSGLRFEGLIVGDETLLVEGRLKGDVNVSQVLVGEGAVLEGSIKAQRVEVKGRVVGTIDAQSVRLHGSSQVHGDVTHGELVVEAGAYLDGRCLPRKKEARSETVARFTPGVVATAPAA